MTRSDFVALADALRVHNRTADGRTEFTPDHLRVLADFCASQDPSFNRKRWIDYVEGQGGELMCVELNPGPIVGDKVVRRVTRDEGSPKSGQKRSSAHG
jgi:hypothetical protein